MTDNATAREKFKESAAAAVKANNRNIIDRGMSGPDSALFVGSNRTQPGLLDLLADAAEAAYGAAPAARAPRSKGV